MKRLKLFQIFLFGFVVALFGIFGVKSVFAGFGVSPATFENDRLKPGSSYTREFTVSRADVSEELSLTISPDLGVMESWFTFSPDTSFTLSPGQQHFNFSTTVKIPVDAELKTYSGYIRILEENKNPKGIQIVEGIRLDVTLSLTNKDIIELLVRNVDIDDIVIGDNLVLKMLIENLGNVDSAPSKAVIEVMDLSQRLITVLETTDIETIPSGTITEVYATFNHNLADGEYYANATIYLGSKVIREELLVFRVNAIPEELPETGKISTVIREIVDNSGYLLALLFVVLLAFVAWFFVLINLKKKEKNKKEKKELYNAMLMIKVSLICLIIAFFIIVILFIRSMSRKDSKTTTTHYVNQTDEVAETETSQGQSVLGMGTEDVNTSVERDKSSSLIVKDTGQEGKYAVYEKPNVRSTVLLFAREDTAFEVVAELDEWFRIKLPGDAMGWIQKTNIKESR